MFNQFLLGYIWFVGAIVLLNAIAVIIAGLVGVVGGAVVGFGLPAVAAAVASSGAGRVGIGLGNQNRMFG